MNIFKQNPWSESLGLGGLSVAVGQNLFWKSQLHQHIKHNNKCTTLIIQSTQKMHNSYNSIYTTKEQHL